MRQGLNSRTRVLILVAIAVAQVLAYSHSVVVTAGTSIGPQHPIVGRDPPSDDWPTYHRDTFRSGYDPEISPFTSVSLNWKSSTLDGDVYAEPLIVGTDVIVATENNSLYELNAATGQTIWHINLGTPVNGGVLPCGDINPSGITSTPVIDTSGGTIFVVAFLQAANGTLHHELFALDLDTGEVRFQLPIDPQGANATIEQQRAALALSNGYVYVAYGGLAGDCGPYHGWLAATDTNGGGPVISYQVPTGRAGGIWGGGDGPVIDGSGDVLVATGNSFSTSVFDFGDSVMKLSPASTGAIGLVDWFAAPNWIQLNEADLDLGSTEPVILSSNFLFQIGKDGIGYLLNATKLGGIGGQLYSSQVCISGHGAYGGLAYAPPYLVVPCDNGVVALEVNLSANPPFTIVWRGPNFLAGPPIIAGNAVWDVDVSDGLIYALSLTSGQTLFHDTIGSLPTHFNSLSAGDGQIFVSANRQVLAYLPQQGSISVTLTGPANGAALTSSYIALTGKVVTSLGSVLKDVQVTFTVNSTPVCGTSGAKNVTATGTFSCNYAVEAPGSYTWSATAEGCLGPVASCTPTCYTAGCPGNITTVTSSSFTFTASPIVQSITLVAGWNLISLPLVPASTAIGNVLASQIAGGNFSVIWSYQGGAWKSATLNPTTHILTGPLTTMQDGPGYWIFMDRADNLFVVGTVFAPPPATPTSYSLPAGWNLIGFKPQPVVQSETVAQYLTSISGSYDQNNVWIYDNTSGNWIRATSTTMLTPGEAMWIFVTSPSGATLRP